MLIDVEIHFLLVFNISRRSIAVKVNTTKQFFLNYAKMKYDLVFFCPKTFLLFIFNCVVAITTHFVDLNQFCSLTSQRKTTFLTHSLKISSYKFRSLFLSISLFARLAIDFSFGYYPSPQSFFCAFSRTPWKFEKSSFSIVLTLPLTSPTLSLKSCNFPLLPGFLRVKGF